MTERSDKKHKFPLYISCSTDAEIEKFVKGGYSKSKNSFINKAIEFYIGYLQNEKNIDFIVPMLSSVIKSQMQDNDRNQSEMMFKLAVEVAKQNYISVIRGEIDEDTLYRLNEICCHDVASNNGRVQFENTYRNQYGDDGDE